MGLSIKLSENGGRAPEAVPYMPAGESVIDASVNGAPGRRRVVATREACERLQRDLEEHLKASDAKKKARPLLMFDHKTDGGAAAVPLGFEWDEERGILLRVEWTQAGREAVEGGNYGYISPSFRLQRGTGEILGLAGGVEVGSLVNDPAFENNECIAAAKGDVPEVVVVHAANPYGCNQHGHGFVGECDLGSGGQKTFDFISETKDRKRAKIQQENDSLMERLREAVKKEEEADEKLSNTRFASPGYDAVSKEWAEAEENLTKLAREARELRKRIRKENPDFELKEDDDKVIDKALEAYDKAEKHEREEAEKLKRYHEELRKKERKRADSAKASRSLPPHENQADMVDMVQNIGVSGEGVGVENRNNNKKNMEEVAKLLGLSADADAAEICAKIAALQKESGDVKKRIEEVEAEKEEHKKALHKHKEEAAMAFAERQKKEGKIAPHDKERLEAARALYLTDSANAELIFAGMKRVDNVSEDGKVDVADQVQAAAAKNYENLSLAELLAAEK